MHLEALTHRDGVWNLQHEATKEMRAQAFLRARLGVLTSFKRLVAMRRGLWSKFGPMRTASGPPRRVRERGRHDAVDAGRRAVPANLREPGPAGPHVVRRARGVQTRQKDHPSSSLLETTPGRRLAIHETAAGSTTFTKIANKWNTALIGADSVFDIELELILVEALASS
jgi:hypothetical protein